LPFAFGDYSLDAGRRELLRGAELIALEPQVFDLLVYLVENRDRVVSKDDLLAAVWGGRIVSESTLTSRISAARKAIGDVGGERQLIRTIARKGLRFVGEVTESRAPSAATAVQTTTAVPQTENQSRYPNNLPLRITAFFGREEDVSKVRALLAASNLITLVGAGGIGKTTLSLEIVSGILDRFEDGVWLVELAPIADPKLLPNAVADALGVLEEPGRALLKTLLDFLRTKSLLIVLDNCEHLIEACARFVDAVLRVSARTRILATSREPLGISGESIWRVPSLPTPEADDRIGAADLVRFPAIRLFAERAKLARASFGITDHNAPLIAQICRQLDGIPLAIELAASRVKAMQIDQIVERLGDRFRLLTGGSRTAPPHQRTLRSTIDWSYGLLSEAERTLLRRLSVFAGGWTLGAAEAVCAEGDVFDVLDTLTQLLDKSLVILDERAAEPRYKMLETIRQYGHDRLVETETLAALSDRHLRYYASLAESIEPRFYHPDQSKWYARVDAELDNTRAALEWGLKSSNIECGMRLVNALHRYWVARVYWMEATDWLRRLLALADTADLAPLQAKALFVAGHISNYYDPVAAERLGEASLRLSRLLDYRQGIVNALWLLGWCASPRLDDTAAPYFAESIALAHEIDHVFGAVHAYAWCGVYKLAIGDYEAAKPMLEAAKEQAHRLGHDDSLLGRCDGNLGLIALLHDDFAAAKTYFDNSLKLVSGAGNKNGTAEALWLHGRLALRRKDYRQAIGYFVESLTLYRFYPDSLWVTRDLAYLAITFGASGERQRATLLAGALHRGKDGSASLKSHLGSVATILEFENTVAALRAALRKSEFGAAWERGRAMTREQAIDYAFEPNA
jgi:predicted ATPase/DNA-binding winged helix-turn-helix (wHTH) protein